MGLNFQVSFRKDLYKDTSAIFCIKMHMVFLYLVKPTQQEVGTDDQLLDSTKLIFSLTYISFYNTAI